MTKKLLKTTETFADKSKEYYSLIDRGFSKEYIRKIFDIQYDIDISIYEDESDNEDIIYNINNEPEDSPGKLEPVDKMLRKYIKKLYDDDRFEKSDRSYYVKYYDDNGKLISGLNASRKVYTDMKNNDIELWKWLKTSYQEVNRITVYIRIFIDELFKVDYIPKICLD